MLSRDHYLGCDKNHGTCQAENCENPGCYLRPYLNRGAVELCSAHALAEYDHHVIKPTLKPV